MRWPPNLLTSPIAFEFTKEMAKWEIFQILWASQKTLSLWKNYVAILNNVVSGTLDLMPNLNFKFWMESTVAYIASSSLLTCFYWRECCGFFSWQTNCLHNVETGRGGMTGEKQGSSCCGTVAKVTQAQITPWWLTVADSARNHPIFFWFLLLSDSSVLKFKISNL